MVLKEKNHEYAIAWLESMADVDQNGWDALALPLPTPFLEWEWLHQMEISGSATAENGWLPRHLTVWKDRQLIAAAPLYIKLHSAGEFVFDHVWADVASRLGVAYYPKLVGMSPFTPMIGYRFLIARDQDEVYLTRLMVDEIDRFCRQYQLSGSSYLFVDPVWRRRMLSHGYCSWQHQSFVWQNQNFQTFDDYLAQFNSNQRRNIKRERRALQKQGITLGAFHGKEIPRDFLSLLYKFYEHTNDKFGPWSCKFLTPEFFTGLYDGFRHRLLMIAAFDGQSDQKPLAMSFLVTKARRLYGRYWGSKASIDQLHFNACYYFPIQWAISRKIHQFDPGAGGGHKIRRGFSAVPNYSLHRFTNPRMQMIMQKHIGEINYLEKRHLDELNSLLPFASTARIY